MAHFGGSFVRFEDQKQVNILIGNRYFYLLFSEAGHGDDFRPSETAAGFYLEEICALQGL